MITLVVLTTTVHVENILPLQKFLRFTFSAEILTKMLPLLANTEAAESSDGYMSLIWAFKFLWSNSLFPESVASWETVRLPLEAAVR